MVADTLFYKEILESLRAFIVQANHVGKHAGFLQTLEDLLIGSEDVGAGAVLEWFSKDVVAVPIIEDKDVQVARAGSLFEGSSLVTIGLTISDKDLGITGMATTLGVICRERIFQQFSLKGWRDITSELGPRGKAGRNSGGRFSRLGLGATLVLPGLVQMAHSCGDSMGGVLLEGLKRETWEVRDKAPGEGTLKSAGSWGPKAEMVVSYTASMGDFHSHMWMRDTSRVGEIHNPKARAWISDTCKDKESMEGDGEGAVGESSYAACCCELVDRDEVGSTKVREEMSYTSRGRHVWKVEVTNVGGMDDVPIRQFNWDRVVSRSDVGDIGFKREEMTCGAGIGDTRVIGIRWGGPECCVNWFTRQIT